MTKQQLMARVAAATVAAALLIALIPSRKQEIQVVSHTEPNLFGFVRSLDGTTPDGKLQTDGEAIVVDAALVRRFEYYLSAIGEKPLDAIRAEIERDIDTRLKGRAADQAKQFLGRYLDYKRALAETEKNAQLAGNGIAAMRARIAALRQTRARFFSEPESQAVFGLEDAHDEDAIARLEISQDASLTDTQKQEKLAALDAALPPALRAAREEPVKIIRLEEAMAKKRAEGASDDEIYRMRASALSPEAAARLAELDREEAAWAARIAAYRAQRQQIINSSPQNVDKVAQLEQLRQSLFTEDERKRLPAYE